MKICTWVSADAPAAHRAVARILVEGGFLPIIFAARTEDEARARAQTDWDAEVAKKAAPTRRGKLHSVEAAPAAVDADPLDEMFG